VPIVVPELQAELIDTLERAFADNQSSWELQADGAWRRRHADGEPPRNMQLEIAALHAARAGERSGGAEHSARVGAVEPLSPPSSGFDSSADW
jgi:polyphosphate kinase